MQEHTIKSQQIQPFELKNKRYIFLINPISGTSKKDAIKSLIEKEAKAREIEYEILPTNAQGDYDFVEAKIKLLGITDIVIIGGDGTVNKVISALRFCNVNFGIVPIGSGNGLARAANIPVKIKSSIELIFNGTAKLIDGFLVNNQFACMLSGVGFDAKVAYDFSIKASRGLFTYTQQSIINFFKAQPYQFEVSLNGFDFFVDAFFISVANSNQFGNNFTIAPQASLNDGLLDVVIVQKMNKAKLPFAILQQMRGNNKLQDLVENMSKKNILYFQTPTITIKNLKLAPLHIDGEPTDTEAVIKFEIIKDCFNLIY